MWTEALGFCWKAFSDFFPIFLRAVAVLDVTEHQFAGCWWSEGALAFNFSAKMKNINMLPKKPASQQVCVHRWRLQEKLIIIFIIVIIS